MGDDGKLYLPAEMVPLYRSNVVPLATVITPNQFEAEQLTEQPIKTEQDALKACQALLQRGPQTVVQFLLCRVFPLLGGREQKKLLHAKEYNV